MSRLGYTPGRRAHMVQGSFIRGVYPVAMTKKSWEYAKCVLEEVKETHPRQIRG